MNFNQFSELYPSQKEDLILKIRHGSPKKMKQVSDEKSEKKNLPLWSTDEVYHWAVNVLNIDNNEAQILKEEDVDGFVLSNLNDLEMKGLNVKFGTKIKLWEGMKNIQK